MFKIIFSLVTAIAIGEYCTGSKENYALSEWSSRGTKEKDC